MWRASFVGRIVLCCAVVPVVSALPVWAQQEPATNQAADKPQAAGRAAVEEVLNKQVELKFDQKPLKELADEWETAHGINFFIDREALDEAGLDPQVMLSADLPRTRLRTALEFVLGQLGMTLVAQDNLVLITTPDEAGSMLETRLYNVKDLVQRRVGDQTIDDYDSLVDVITSTVDPTTWDEVGGAGSIPVYSGMLLVSQTQDTLRQIDNLLRALRQIQGNAAEGKELPVSIGLAPDDAYREILKLLHQPVTLELDNRSLTAVAHLLREKYGLPAVTDRQALQEIGIPEDGLISLEVEDVPLRQALQLVLNKLDLQLALRDDLLLITSSDEAQSELQVRLYPVGDLVEPVADFMEPGAGEFGNLARGVGSFGCAHRPAGVGSDYDYEGLIDAITSAVAPMTWDEVGGQGSIAEFDPAKTLVISQTFEVHQQIESLLKEMRKVKVQQAQLAGDAEPADPDAIRTNIIQLAGNGTKVAADEVAKLVQELVAPESWKEEQVLIRTIGDRLVIRHRPSVQRQVNRLLDQLGVLPGQGGGGFGSGMANGGFGGGMGGLGGGGAAGGMGGGGIFSLDTKAADKPSVDQQ